MTHEQKPESAEFRTREDLLPCPFCGAPAERLDFDNGDNIGGSCISCTRCGASGHVEFGFKENFVSQWNTRVSNAVEQRRKDVANVAALEARVKELEAEVERMKKAEWYINQNEEAAAFDIATIMDGADLWEIKEVEGCRIVEKAWAYVDDYGHIHKFPTKAEAKSAADAICAWAESLKKR